MNDTTRDGLERRIADLIDYEICGYIPSIDPILYLEGNDHGNQVESVTREVIREIVAARDAEIRELLLTHADGYIVAKGQDGEAAFATKPWMEQILNAIGLHGNGTGGQG